MAGDGDGGVVDCAFSLRKFATDIMSYPAVECLLFDLNDTLYSSEAGIGEAIVKNIEAFLVEKCGIAEEKAPSMCNELYIKYGTTLAGLKAIGYDVNDLDLHEFVKGRMPAYNYKLIKPNPLLRSLLLSIKQRKILFTNSHRNHAIKILESIGLQDCFEQMITFETLNANLLLQSKADRRLGEFPVIMKPSVEAMKIALDVVQVDPRRVVFLDNDERNIVIGKAEGFRTVLVGKPVKCTEADYVAEDLADDLRSLIPELWENGTNN